MVQKKLGGLLWEKSQLAQHEKNEIIGEFGVHIVDAIFSGGEVFQYKSDSRGDILHPEYGLMEVKMSSSRHQPTVDENQFLRHMEDSCDGYLYVFVRYNPSQRTKMLTTNGKTKRLGLMKKTIKTSSQTRQFLSERVKEVFLVDISVILAIWSCDPVRSTQITEGGRERSCLNVPVRDLRQFASGSADFFNRFGLDVTKYTVTAEEVESVVGEHITKVKVHKICKTKPKKNFNLCLNFESEEVIVDSPT